MNYLRNATFNEERGRTMTEVLAVLSIIGVLSVVGVWGFNLLQEKHEENELAHQIAINALQIKAAFQSKDYKDAESFEEFLAGLTTHYKNYILSYHLSETFDQTYIMEIADKDGNYIKGKKCHQILRNLANNKDSTNLSFKIDDEETQTEEEIWLAGKYVAIKDICGG